MDCRGATRLTNSTRQRDKIVSAIVAMDADVIGLMEIENHPTDAAHSRPGQWPERCWPEPEHTTSCQNWPDRHGRDQGGTSSTSPVS